MSALPTYITSGASSRAHHAYLAKLHQSQSQSASSSSGVPTGFGAGGEHGKGNGRDEESIVEDEVIRCLKTLGGRGVSNVSYAP